MQLSTTPHSCTAAMHLGCFKNISPMIFWHSRQAQRSSCLSAAGAPCTPTQRQVRAPPLFRLPARHFSLSVVSRSNGTAAADDDEDGLDVPGKALRVERLLANLGYGKRKECQTMVKKGVVMYTDGRRVKIGDKVQPGDILVDGEPVDDPFPLTIVLHKPTGYVVTSPDDERVVDPTVYDLLPYRWSRRRPMLSAVGRLDKETSGLLMMTDDGQLLHRIISPAKGIWKVYMAQLAQPLAGKAAEDAARLFASGTMVLGGSEIAPLLPAQLTMLSDTTARVAISEGKYHQVRRMFAAVGSEVVALRRTSIGDLQLGDLQEGSWRYASADDIRLVLGAAVGKGSSSSVQQASSGTGSAAGAAAGADALGQEGRVDTGNELDEAEEAEGDVEDMEEFAELQAEQKAANRRFRNSTKARLRRQMLKRSLAALGGAGAAVGAAPVALAQEAGATAAQQRSDGSS